MLKWSILKHRTFILGNLRENIITLGILLPRNLILPPFQKECPAYNNIHSFLQEHAKIRT